jgi:hypothetical protein
MYLFYFQYLDPKEVRKCLKARVDICSGDIDCRENNDASLNVLINLDNGDDRMDANDSSTDEYNDNEPAMLI